MERLENEVLIYLELYFLNKIKIARFSLNNNIFSKMNIKTDMKNLKKNFKKIKNIKLLDILKKSKLQIEEAYLNTKIGTDDIILTALLVTIISSVARNIT